jgi:uncharacterized protein DUF3800
MIEGRYPQVRVRALARARQLRKVLGMYFERPLVRAYIDETGDRGTSGKASRFFAMVAVLIADEDDPSLRRAIEMCRRRLSVPAGKPLHWTEHVKRFPRRQFVAGQLAAVDGVMVNFVLVEKAVLPVGDPIRGDQVAFYNYVAGLILEGILSTASGWPGGVRDVVVTFGHVRGFPHHETLAYFEKQRASAVDQDSWELLRSKPRFSGRDSWTGCKPPTSTPGCCAQLWSRTSSEGSSTTTCSRSDIRFGGTKARAGATACK